MRTAVVDTEPEDPVVAIIGTYAVFPASCNDIGSPRLFVTKTSIADFSRQFYPWKVDIALTQEWTQIAGGGAGIGKEIPVYLTFSVVPDNKIAVTAFRVISTEDLRAALEVAGIGPNHPFSTASDRPSLKAIRHRFDYPPSADEISRLLDYPSKTPYEAAVLLQPC